MVEAGLGNKEKALALLERAVVDHDDDGLLDLENDPAYDSLRSDPRFEDLINRVGLHE